MTEMRLYCMQIRVTIIMGMYNCASTLSQALDSIINQTYEEWTLIMCDDGSKDKTYEVAMEYAQKYAQKIVLIRNDKEFCLNYNPYIHSHIDVPINHNLLRATT